MEYFLKLMEYFSKLVTYLPETITEGLNKQKCGTSSRRPVSKKQTT